MTDPIELRTGGVAYVPAPGAPVVIPGPLLTIPVMPVRGPTGPPGVGSGALSATAVTARALSGHRVVTMTPGGLDYASSDDIGHATAVLWLTVNSWDADVPADVITRGVVEEGSWAFADGPLFLGLNGMLSSTIPGGALFSRIVAGVVDSTTIDFGPQPAIVLGA